MIAALIIGFVGSLHCVGMCGPLSLFMVSKNPSFGGMGLYHTGRIFSYVLLGLFLGWLGYSIELFHAQQLVTITLGALLIILYSVPQLRNQLERFYYQSKLYHFAKAKLMQGLSGKSRWLFSGMANGFLPCGLTYVAAAGSVALGGFVDGALFMLLFGLGTIPALAAVSLGGMYSSKTIKKIIPRAIPVIAIASGCLLIMRGLLLASPDFNQLVQAKAAGLITVCGL